LNLSRKHRLLFVLLLLLLAVLLLFNIGLGQVSIPVNEVLKSIFGSKSSKDTWEYILFNYRFPKAITALLVGVGLSVCGLFMQTLFRNPLAGPYVLGLSSGSSLGVALVIMGASFMPQFLADSLLSNYGIILASSLGSFFVLLAVLFVSQKLKNTMAILIVGLMFSSFTSAIVSTLSFFTTAEQLQKFTFWSMGNLGNLSWSQVFILLVTVLVGLLLGVFQIKALDALLLGENYAKSLGVNFRKSQFMIIVATSLLSGGITAFVGPIAFIGLAVPHITKLVFQTSKHWVLFWGTLCFGAITMLVCDLISQLLLSGTILPINSITSIVGAPIVIWLLLKKRNFS
jgi:iron complex transport system permease protein